IDRRENTKATRLGGFFTLISKGIMRSAFYGKRDWWHALPHTFINEEHNHEHDGPFHHHRHPGYARPVAWRTLQHR
ncbi:hypothetical protein, partial [Serratia marcescens]|uniref:hypothetical protein n=1 Tax=Serratia marcescens TaxID=615 RepID=UPI0024CB3F67